MNARLIPEPATSRAQYEREVLAPLYAALAPLDPQRALACEWANARGAIPRFDRSAIEIRVLDVQECPAADLALAALVVDLVQLFYEDNNREAPETGQLLEIFLACVRDGERARIDSPLYGRSGEAREVWAYLAGRLRAAPHRALWAAYLGFVLERGPLARRLLEAAGEKPSRAELAGVYAMLCECLEHGRLYDPSSSS